MREKSERQVLPVTSIDDMTSEIMKGLQEYADLADTEVKKQSEKLQPKLEKRYLQMLRKHWCLRKSWTAKKVSENSHSLQMTVYSKNRYQLAHLLSMVTPSVAVGVLQEKPHIAPAEEKVRKCLRTS